jgi:hypothetical protein
VARLEARLAALTALPAWPPAEAEDAAPDADAQLPLF